ncbi:MAG: hypothetical protein R3E79_41730 [Caldilineaceae bacterium]
MAYTYTNSKGRSYILHSRDTTLKNGTKQTIYFFASEAKDGALDAIPNGYEVSESKNGLPVLKRKAAAPEPEPAKPAKAPRKSSRAKKEA